MHFRESRKEIENKMETKSRKMKFTDLKDMLNQTGEVYGDRPAYIFKTEEKGKFRTITHKEFRENINALGTTLIQMGLKDKRIALISENRYEWELSYLAVASGVGVIVPLDKALPDNELESLILRSQVEAIIYSSKYDVIMNTLREKKNTNLKYFISMDLEENTQGIYAEKALVEKGKKLLADGNKTYIDAKIDSEKMGIMLFTSGTTAMSKAVMLSHKNLVTNVMDIIQRFDLTDEDRFLSFLPLHHVFECTVGFLYPISIGGSIAFCEGVKHMAENIKEFEITAMISVPAVFDIIYRKVMKTIEKKGKLANLEKGKKVSQFLLKMKIDLRKQLFKEVHESLGPKLKLVVTGGAALDPETEKGFNDLGFDRCLDDYIQNMKESNVDILFVTDIDEVSTKISEYRLLILFRMIQEAVQNSIIHSKSDRIELSVKNKGNQLLVKIRDYGIGFEDGNKKENHFGLSMMQERAKIIHAVFQIHSVLNEGTEITIQVAADE